MSEDTIVCLVCGGSFRQLTNTHLRSHGLTSADYKARFGYNLRRPLFCLQLQRRYRERAVVTDLASRIRHRPIVTRPELRRRGGLRPVSREERLNRSDAQRRARVHRGVGAERAVGAVGWTRSLATRSLMVTLLLLVGAAEAASVWLWSGSV